ncbi:MAG: hypothetical protein WBX19_17650, partial [Terracidiphilus sp.]
EQLRPSHGERKEAQHCSKGTRKNLSHRHGWTFLWISVSPIVAYADAIETGFSLHAGHLGKEFGKVNSVIRRDRSLRLALVRYQPFSTWVPVASAVSSRFR